MSGTPYRPDSGQQLSRRTKFIYGLGDWGTSAATVARNAFWFIFLTNVVGIGAGLAGTVVLVGHIWDSINDPANAVRWVIGADVVEADKLRTGKRHEGIYAGYLAFSRKMASALAIFVVGQPAVSPIPQCHSSFTSTISPARRPPLLSGTLSRPSALTRV
jgi:Na+/melibiose symporter-like transporter